MGWTWWVRSWSGWLKEVPAGIQATSIIEWWENVKKSYWNELSTSYQSIPFPSLEEKTVSNQQTKNIRKHIISCKYDTIFPKAVCTKVFFFRYDIAPDHVFPSPLSRLCLWQSLSNWTKKQKANHSWASEREKGYYEESRIETAAIGSLSSQ